MRRGGAGRRTLAPGRRKRSSKAEPASSEGVAEAASPRGRTIRQGVSERIQRGLSDLQGERERIGKVIARRREDVAARGLLPGTSEPYLSLLRAPREPMTREPMPREIRVATYNVHRWQGINGRSKPDAARAGFVISELDADVIALQEVLRPEGAGAEDGDPLERLADALGMHLAFAVTRQHRRGALGNAILSRFPISGLSVLDISHSRIERRGALTAQFQSGGLSLGVVATHLSLVDRTRQRQVKALLEHPHLQSGAAILLGDMNAWRKCKASRELDDELSRHNNLDWPASFPSARPVLALDRIYARGADVVEVSAHSTPASRRASDHLPVIARIVMKEDEPVVA